jgi:hypothetical protein
MVSRPIHLGVMHPFGTHVFQFGRYSHFMDPMENTTSHSTSGVVCVHCLDMALLMLCIYIVTGWECQFLWPHNSCQLANMPHCFLLKACHSKLPVSESPSLLFSWTDLLGLTCAPTSLVHKPLIVISLVWVYVDSSTMSSLTHFP